MTFHCGTKLMKRMRYRDITLLLWLNRFESDMPKTSDLCRLSKQGPMDQMEDSFLYLPSGWREREMGRCAGGERPRTVQRTASCGTDGERITHADRLNVSVPQRCRSCDQRGVLCSPMCPGKGEWGRGRVGDVLVKIRLLRLLVRQLKIKQTITHSRWDRQDCLYLTTKNIKTL